MTPRTSPSPFNSAASPLFAASSTPISIPAPAPLETPTVEVRQGSELADSNLDWSLVYEIRERVTTALSEATALGDDASNDDRRQYSRQILPAAVEEFSNQAVRTGNARQVIYPPLRPLYCRAVEEAIFGYGRWTPLMEDPDVEDIEFRGYEHSFMVYGDRVTPAVRVADSDHELIAQVQHLATYMSSTRRTFSVSNPAVTLNLQDRFRLHAIGFDIVDRPTIVIRQHKHTLVTLPELVDLGMMPAKVADFLAASMIAGKAIIVSGNMGAGKTTMLRALAAALPPLQAIGVIESDPELFLHKMPGRHRIINLLAREGSPEAVGTNGRPAGEFGLDRLLKESKRQRLNSVSVGEILGNEAATLFEAMQSGAGSFSTIHSKHASATIERIVTAAAQGGILSTEDAYRQVGTLLDLIVHIRTVDRRPMGGRLERSVEQILEIQGFQEGADGNMTSRPATQVIYNVDDPTASLNLSPELDRDLTAIGWKGAK